MSEPIRIRRPWLKADISLDAQVGTDPAGNPILVLWVELLPGTELAAYRMRHPVDSEHPTGHQTIQRTLAEKLSVCIRIEPVGLVAFARKAAMNIRRKARLRWVEARASRPSYEISEVGTPMVKASKGEK